MSFGLETILVLVLAAAAGAISAAAPPILKLQQQPMKVCDQTQAFFERCNLEGPGWIKYRGSCYRYFETPEYWEPAERNCSHYGGHLMSVANQAENSFLGKLTYCQAAWIGRYAVDADLMWQASNYRWTDGSTNQYHDPHNFTAAALHHPLIYAKDLQWFNAVYHGKQNFVCKVKTDDRDYTCNCPTGWKELNNYCYHSPNVEATYIEADFYCRGRDSYLTSVHSDAELRALSLVDVDSYGCPPELWIGLVKLNPCRMDFSTGTPVCYRWSDRSGNHQAFPKWLSGHPINDQQTNCVLLKDREIKTVPCYTRARFVCKKKVGK